jgi:hypothetical protein
LNNLLAETQAATSVVGADSSASGPTNSPEPVETTKSTGHTKTAKKSQPDQAPADLVDSSPGGDSGPDSYPHITVLEKAILGKSYIGQTLSGRIERMEKKAFGTASSNTDLSERTDALDDYAEKNLHKKFFDQDQEIATNAPNVGTGSSDTGSSSPGDYPRVTALEMAILSQSHPGDQLKARLGRMELKAFGAASSNDDLSQRTDALERYAQKSLHKKPFGQEQRQQTADSDGQPGSGAGKQIMSIIGNSLLGMTGMGGFGAMNGGGFGPGGTGFHGMRQQQRNQEDQESSANTQARSEDPAIYEPFAPAASARTIVKVGWCEMQVFGKTFSAMHLPDRLGQLSKELNFETNKSKIELMDDIGLMVKTVAVKKGVPSIGSKSGGSVH